jgi:hypothetical protein
MLEFYFTTIDEKLIKGVTTRDPLGFQLIWSSQGRHIVPNLTETTNRIQGFQLLLTALKLCELYEEYRLRRYDEYRDDLKNQNIGQIFSTENVFLLLEQAFAHAYYKVHQDWMLPGKRQVSAYQNDTPFISLGRQILQSQLVNGIWGLYRGAALRSGLIDVSGYKINNIMDGDLKSIGYIKDGTKRYLFGLITESLIEGEKPLPPNRNHSLHETLAGIIHRLPDKSVLYEYLMMKNTSTFLEDLAFFANDELGQNTRNKRSFFKKCVRKFPEYSKHFENIIKCEDFIAPLENLFYWILCFPGKSPREISKALPVKLELMESAKRRFQEINTFTGSAKERWDMYLRTLDTEHPERFVQSLIDIHTNISNSRGSSLWITLSDTQRIILEQDPWSIDDILENRKLAVEPGRDWQNNYYIDSLINIYRGVK